MKLTADKMFVNLFHLTSKPKEETHPELHKRYADVQFWICGEELCGVAPFIGKGECIDAREDDDLYFYDGIENEVLHPCDGRWLCSVFPE